MTRHLKFQVAYGRQLLAVELPEQASVTALIRLLQQELNLSPSTMRVMLPRVKGPPLRLEAHQSDRLIDIGAGHCGSACSCDEKLGGTCGMASAEGFTELGLSMHFTGFGSGMTIKLLGSTQAAVDAVTQAKGGGEVV